MSGSTVLPIQRNGILPDPDLHSQHVNCHPLLGLILDLGGCIPRQSSSWNHDCLDNDHTEFGSIAVVAKGITVADWRRELFFFKNKLGSLSKTKGNLE